MLLASYLAPAAVSAAEPAAGNLNPNELALLENRFFSHTYAHDPLEKRLERIECLVYGSTREGSNQERMARLKKTVAERSAQPLKSASEKDAVKLESNNNANKIETKAEAPSSSKQYPILNTLEWRALKKTYQSESLDQRLDRLESKMFGQPAQTMAYIDRVDRLKRTLGIGVETASPDGITATGPLPKARPRGEESEINGFNFPQSFPQIGDLGMTPGFGGPPGQAIPSFPLGNELMPFSGNPLGGLRQMQQLFQSMEKQMADMRRLGPGTWVKDPKTNEWIDLSSGRRISPDGKPKGTAPGAAPPALDQGIIREIPGYADPNSI